jgi:hypothetical protein
MLWKRLKLRKLRSAKIKLEKKLKSVENLLLRQYQTKSTNKASYMSISLLSTLPQHTDSSQLQHDQHLSQSSQVPQRQPYQLVIQDRCQSNR